ncbi:DNA-binding transcriptional ArsR family regulator [Nakamurella sp. UYEF19]|uniref:ArsR/SmtB family transcription factor n=1 Tax=Nakamurella sp. UYEF19 TaxID=1756392 RepID=UPI00339A42D5
MSNHSMAESILDALGDPQRRQIVQHLRDGPLPVGKLAERLTIGRPAVSKHLRVLSDVGLVTHQPVGTRNLYALAPEALVPLQQWLTQFWTDALEAFADHVSGQQPAPGKERP